MGAYTNGEVRVVQEPGYLEKDTALYTDRTTDTTAPTVVTDGFALDPDTRDVTITVFFETPGGLANLDAHIRMWDGFAWFLIASQLDIQDLAGDRWQRRIPNAYQFGSRIDVELDNVLPDVTGLVQVTMTEST
ncbi:MAG: hypothetical protein KKB59_20185 [Spirochaetes bacterium]|nr:hypothetical protein [Spirochaetota bacterium]